MSSWPLRWSAERDWWVLINPAEIDTYAAAALTTVVLWRAARTVKPTHP